MTFKDWWIGFHPEPYPFSSARHYTKKDLQAAWDAATYAINQEQGIAANEAEKDARRKAAMEKIKHLIEDFYGNAWTGADEIEAFIKEAQG